MKESPAHALAEALCECRASVVSTSPLRNTRFLFLRKALAHFAIHPLRADLQAVRLNRFNCLRGIQGQTRRSYF